MDYFAVHGRMGSSCNVPAEFIPGTDIGCMSVLGYDPRKYFTGRGPLEAAELGITLRPSQLAFRCNLVTTEGEVLKDFCADHISTEEARVLLDALNDALKKDYGKKAVLYAGRGTGYRNLMIYEKADTGMESVVCAPPHDIMGKKYEDHFPKGRGGEILTRIMERSKEIFADHPVNRRRIHDGRLPATMVWLWGQGYAPSLPSYYERFGLHGGVITAVDLVKGLAIHAGLDVITVPGVTGFLDTSYAAKAEYALNALRSRDFVAVHAASTDEASHMGDVQLKIKAIEDIDRLLLGPLSEGLKEFKDYKVLILPDHCTLVETRTHSRDPVPFLIFSSQETQKGPKKFCEKTAEQSGWSVAEGYTIMDFFIRGAGHV
jgi:2,3-bisphosphoglycerate-independent phosphoglycerate mutase